MILNNQILKDSQTINTSNEALRDQGPNKSIEFRGTLMTNGVGLSAVKQKFEASRGSTNGP
ncbi:hypothetical protein HPULCUR_005922 [Helicostylum pulchrum]|uniref:Uncharacterized protein n=1 Tax=Helicostylum pulchrum TaxID=562976 RepID=A0ABP9Y0G2_9FUNG